MSDANAAAKLAFEHHRGLYHWALALTGRNAEEAEEIVQQVYVEVLEGRAPLLEAANPRAFLFGVARRVAASRRRRRSIWSRISERIRHEPPSAPDPTPEDAARLDEDVVRVKNALARLPERQSQVLTLVFAEGMTVEEAAAIMGVSVGSARTHYHRAKQAMARLLEVYDADGRSQEATRKSA